MEKKTTILGVVMAGGQSRRMSQDKATLRHPKDVTFLNFSINLLRRLGLEVVVSGAFYANVQPDIQFVPDDERHKGPLAGLNAVLSRYPNHPLLVIPVDMPALTVELLSLLISKPLKNRSFGRVIAGDANSKNCVVGTFFPFPLFLSSSAQDSIKKALQDQKWALMPVLESLKLEKIPLKAVWAGQMRNVNTPIELQSFYDTPGL